MLVVLIALVGPIAVTQAPLPDNLVLFQHPLEMILLPVLVPLYLVGRGFFALGYAQGAAAPAFGMALTGASTIAAFGIAVVLMGLGR